MWNCPKCGYTFRGDVPPAVCPGCQSQMRNGVGNGSGPNNGGFNAPAPGGDFGQPGLAPAPGALTPPGIVNPGGDFHQPAPIAPGLPGSNYPTQPTDSDSGNKSKSSASDYGPMLTAIGITVGILVVLILGAVVLMVVMGQKKAAPARRRRRKPKRRVVEEDDEDDDDDEDERPRRRRRR